MEIAADGKPDIRRTGLQCAGMVGTLQGEQDWSLEQVPGENRERLMANKERRQPMQRNGNSASDSSGSM